MQALVTNVATLGCSRTGEVPSLQLHDDGTASCLTIKTKLSLPEERTFFACPGEWIERWDLHNVDIPGGVRWQSPQSWDAKRSENWVAAWLQWRCRSAFKTVSDELTPGFDLYSSPTLGNALHRGEHQPIPLCSSDGSHPQRALADLPT
ncbi:hypothetical protein Syncc9605_0950 [Synechococcus sp. CC9605]|nr:hypothetical protein Syncc9605_0950 [Synechococcus sp. CC9605]